jgi:hypothetical protein
MSCAYAASSTRIGSDRPVLYLEYLIHIFVYLSILPFNY